MSTPYTDTANTPAAAAPPPLAAVTRSGPYLLLWTVQLAAMLAGFFNYVAVAWLTLQLTGSTLAVGSVLAAGSVPVAALLLFGGVASDRFSPRTTMLASALVHGVVVAVLALLTLTHSVHYWELFAGAVLVGSASAFFFPASMSMVPRVVAPEQLEAGNALLRLSRTLAMLLGPPLAGVVVAAAGAGWALAGDATVSLLGGLLVVLLPAGGRVANPSGNPLADVRDGILNVWGDVRLRAALLVIAVLNLFVLAAVEVGLPVLAHQRFSSGAVALGAAFAAWGVGSTIGAIAAGARPAPPRFGWLMVGMVALTGAGMAATGVISNLSALLVVMLFVGVVEGLGTTYLMSWIQRRTDPALQGRVMSLVLLSSTGLEPVALAAAGAVASQSLGLLFWGCAAAIEVTALGAGLSRSVRRM